MRTLIATLVVPLVVICGFLLAGAFSPGRMFEDFASAVLTVVVQYVFFLAFTGAVVVLLRLLWRRWDFMRGWVATAIGTAIGSGVMITFGIMYSSVPAFSSRPIPWAGYARGVLILGITGAVAGYIFWLIANSEMRPNKSLERTREG
jgi:hypothetical protein